MYSTLSLQHCSENFCLERYDLMVRELRKTLPRPNPFFFSWCEGSSTGCVGGMELLRFFATEVLLPVTARFRSSGSPLAKGKVEAFSFLVTSSFADGGPCFIGAPMLTFAFKEGTSAAMVPALGVAFVGLGRDDLTGFATPKG